MLLNFSNQWIEVSAQVAAPGALLVAAPGTGKILRLRSLEFSNGGASPVRVSARFGAGTLIENNVAGESITIVDEDIEHTLAFHPLKQQTIELTVEHAGGTTVLRDDVNGKWLYVSGASMTNLGGTINYATGEITVTADEDITDALGDYTYHGETCSLSGGVPAVHHTLARVPVRAGSVLIAINFDGGSCVLADDGIGSFTHVSGDVPSGYGALTINYDTGVVVAEFDDDMLDALATYRYDTERLLGYTQVGLDYRSALPAEGLEVTPDGTTNHQLYVAASVASKCNAVYMAVER